MTTITAYGPYAYNLTSIDANDFVHGLSYSRGATAFRINYGGGDFDIFGGSGFTYDALGYPKSGVVNAFSHYENNALGLTIRGIGGVTAQAIVAVAKTVATPDDQALLRALLTGNDVLTGANAADVINGYGGNDEIAGGRARDVLSGGIGADDFNYKSVLDSSAGAGRDRSSDFQIGIDDIELSVIDANGAGAGSTAFAYRGTAAFTGAAGQVRWFQLAGNTYVAADTNGDKVADFQIELAGAKTLTIADFIL
ncbi:MAG: M10 family metallopeptidase C-terminal domain-containing protein [Hyphomicrobium sp.]